MVGGKPATLGRLLSSPSHIRQHSTPPVKARVQSRSINSSSYLIHLELYHYLSQYNSTTALYEIIRFFVARFQKMIYCQSLE